MKPGEDHRKHHAQYKKLVDILLEGFCEDNKIGLDQAIKGIRSMNQVPDLKEVFQVIFEQVLAAVDFDIFFSVMCKRNITIQEQALLLLISMTGNVPYSLSQEDHNEEPKGQAGPVKKKQEMGNSQMTSENMADEDILRKAMAASMREEEVRTKRVTQEEKDLQKTLAMSQLETERLGRDRRFLDEDMKKLSLTEKVPGASSSGASKPFAAVPMGATAATSRPAPRQPMMAKHPQKDISNSSAASDWLKTAQVEAGKSTTHAAVVAQMSKMSPDELKKRQEYLKDQRDKLLAMKKEEREKQLSVAEKTTKRPSSARAARKAMEQSSAASPSQSQEDEKKMAMRRAIADKLKLEVIGKP